MDLFQKEVFSKLADEFGGLAGWYSRQNGGWSQDAVVDALLRLYDRRDLLEGVEDQKERGRVALGAMTENPYSAQLKLAEEKFNERREAA